MELERPQMTTWRCVACWISKATRARTDMCKAYCFSTTTIVLWTCLNVTLYVHCLPCSCRILMKLEFSRQIFEISSNIKFHQNPSSGSRVVVQRRTDGRKDEHDEANIRFSQFATSIHYTALIVFKIYLIIIFPSTPRYSKWSLSIRWPRLQLCVHFCSPSYFIHVPSISSFFLWST
jgi:hypothetical protein